MLHGGETWAPNVLDLQLLQRNDRAMVRWICRVKLIDHVHTDQLLIKLGVIDIIECLRLHQLRWYGHVVRSTAMINQITTLAVPGTCGRGRPRKTWTECVVYDLNTYNLNDVDPHDRETWRKRIKDSLVLPTPDPGTTAAP